MSCFSSSCSCCSWSGGVAFAAGGCSRGCGIGDDDGGGGVVTSSSSFLRFLLVCFSLVSSQSSSSVWFFFRVLAYHCYYYYFHFHFHSHYYFPRYSPRLRPASPCAYASSSSSPAQLPCVRARRRRPVMLDSKWRLRP